MAELPTGNPLTVASPRKEEQYRRWAALNGSLKSLAYQELLRRHDSKHLGETKLVQHLDGSVDTYSYIVRLLADAFRIAPSRRFDNPTDTILWNAIVSPSFDVAMEEALRLAYACCVSFIRPYVKDDVLNIEVIPPHLADVKWITPTTFESIKYMISSDQAILWTNDFYQMIDSNDKPISPRFPHGYGTIPIVAMRTTYPTSQDFWTWKRRGDLLEAAVLICVWNTYISRIAAYQSHLQLVERPISRDNASDVAPNLEITDEAPTGADTILRGNYDVINLEADLQKFIANVETRIRRIASNYGLSPEMIQGSSFRSAEERYVAHTVLAEHRDSLIKLVRPADNLLMDIARKVWNVDGSFATFTDSQAEIDYAEPQPVWSPTERIKLAEAKQRLGIESSVDELMRDNPDIPTRERAMEIILLRLEEQRIVQEARRSFQIPNELPTLDEGER